MNGYASSESSASPRDLSPLVSGTDSIVSNPASLTMDQNISDAALSSPDDSMYGVDSDQEQLEYPYRPMTQGEEETVRIYKDGVCQHSDMIEGPGGFQIQRYCVRPRRPIIESSTKPNVPEFGNDAHCRTALHRTVASPAMEAAKDVVEASQIVGAAKVFRDSNSKESSGECSRSTLDCRSI